MCKFVRKEVLIVAPEQSTPREKGDYEHQIKEQVTQQHGGPGIKVIISFIHCKKFNPQKPLFTQKAKGVDLIVSGIGPITCPGITAPIVQL